MYLPMLLQLGKRLPKWYAYADKSKGQAHRAEIRKQFNFLNMAHKLDNSKGFYAFVSYSQPAWHGLGTVMTDVISAKDALIKGGLDFQVIKSPNIHRFAGEDSISTESFFNYRDDTNAILAHHVGKQYTVFQNDSALNIIDEILQSRKATIETAGSIDLGRKVFILLKYAKDINVSGDITKTYCLIFTSHDGSLPIVVLPTNVRVVCNNTLQLDLKENQDKISKFTLWKKLLGKIYKILRLLYLGYNQQTLNPTNEMPTSHDCKALEKKVARLEKVVANLVARETNKQREAELMFSLEDKNN